MPNWEFDDYKILMNREEDDEEEDIYLVYLFALAEACEEGVQVERQ